MRFYEADNRSVVMEIYDKFYLFDLEKMDVSIVFPGRVVDTRVCILTKRKRTYNSNLHFTIHVWRWQYSQHSY
ncbi:hypothetical protein DPMN_129849 [Dreissena polymorpha]|uniref:Uncharacterized protein n=1 Tax=Dreissena polymorpha TaxID=45954 RepID=A0A9D4H3H3_DREPO|nr:hypothetical protein DPMN_129849 [Dreissena polymorpha]